MTRALPPGFVALSSKASLFMPPADDALDINTGTSRTPSLVILCTWASANPRHIAKYTTTYQSLLPHARILLLQSSMTDMIWQPRSWQREYLRPAVYVIQAARAAMAACSGASSPSTGSNEATKATPDRTGSAYANTNADTDAHILLHVMSNGGVNTSIQLQNLLKSAGYPPLIPCAHIIDSAPSRGDPSYKSAVRALTDSLPPRPTWIRLVAMPLIQLFVLWSTLRELIGWMNVLYVNWNEFLDATGLFANQIGQRVVKRVYLYSKADAIVPWMEVHEHAEWSKSQGFEVKEVVFEKTAHVNHAAEPGRRRYWDAVLDAIG